MSLNKLNPRFQNIIKRINPNEKILDLGCVRHSLEKAEESGFLHQELQDRFDSVKGVDISKSEVDKIRDKYGYDVRHGNVENLDELTFSKFDTIIAGELIEHLENPGTFFEQAKNFLSDDGRLILTTPNTFQIYRFVDFYKSELNVNKQHTCWFDLITITQLSRRFGLEVIDYEYIISGPLGIRGVVLPNKILADTLLVELEVDN